MPRKRTIPRVTIACGRCGNPVEVRVTDLERNVGKYCCVRASIEIDANGSTARIPLKSRSGSVRAHALIDITDADWASQWTWGITNGYVTRTEWNGGGANRRMFYLHRELMRLIPGDGIEVDHIDRDRLNNRRTNLRVVTHAQQLQNRPQVNNGWTSQYRGVSWHALTQKWRARVEIDGESHYLGIFSTEEEAAEVARAARARLMPYATN